MGFQSAPRQFNRIINFSVKIQIPAKRENKIFSHDPKYYRQEDPEAASKCTLNTRNQNNWANLYFRKILSSKTN